MQFFKNKWLKVGLFIALSVLAVGVIIYSTSENKIPPKIAPQSAISLKLNPEKYYDNFWAENISIVKRVDNDKFFTLSVNKLVHRKRTTRLFVYQNLKELYVSGVQVNTYPAKVSARGYKRAAIALPVEDIGSSFTSFGKPPTQLEEYLAGDADFNLDLLSRLILENFSLTMHLPGNKKIFLSARVARINTDLENIVLEGPVRFIAADGSELYASLAVWSKKFNGIYLPSGYTFQNEQRKKKAFYGINPDGEFEEAAKVPDIKYVDLLEDVENKFYDRMFKKAPLYLRVLAGMTEGQQ